MRTAPRLVSLDIARKYSDVKGDQESRLRCASFASFPPPPPRQSLVQLHLKIWPSEAGFAQKRTTTFILIQKLFFLRRCGVARDPKDVHDAMCKQRTTDRIKEEIPLTGGEVDL
jgi:hypothetical protein